MEETRHLRFTFTIPEESRWVFMVPMGGLISMGAKVLREVFRMA